jgi:hypothetical protein
MNKEIVSQKVTVIEDLLKNLMKEFVDNEEKPDLETIENILKTTIANIIKVVISFCEILIQNTEYKDDMICEKCGRKMKLFKKNSKLSIMTIFGAMQIIRNYLICRKCSKTRYEGMLALGINCKHRISKGLADIVTYVGQLVAFGEGAKLIKKFIGYMNVKVSENTIWEITEEIGKKVYEDEITKAEEFFYNMHKIKINEEKKQKGIFYILMDGSHINTREKNDKGSSFREMKLGEIFNNKDIINRKNGDSIITQKSYCAYFGNVAKFKQLLIKKAFDNGYFKYEKVVIIGDGAKWIWNLCEELFPNSVEILDYYHLDENVNDYAKVAISNELERKRWINNVLDNVINGNENKALELVEDKAIPKDKLPAGIVNLPEYIRNNINRMTYKKFKESGFYIGSGPIESGNKTVIQQRLKQAGMRWSISGGQYIATLRAKEKSSEWSDVKKAM